jgi:hypothetical protein
MQNFWSSISRFLVCLLAIGITCFFLVFGRNFSFAQPPAVQAQPGVNPAAANASNPKSPVVKALLEALSQMGASDATDEERRMVREQLLKADHELATSLGDNSRNKIMQANNRLQAVRVRGEVPSTLPPPRPRLVPGARGVSARVDPAAR